MIYQSSCIDTNIVSVILTDTQPLLAYSYYQGEM